MARHDKEFTAFGIAYRTKQFSAVDGFRFIDKKGMDHPCQILACTDAWWVDQWHSLGNPNNLQFHVIDVARVIPPLAVLRGIISVVRDFNFGFLPEWKGVKVPLRFMDDGSSVQTANVSPVISAIIDEQSATLRELEEYYSVKDAFDMFDIITSKGLNQAIAQENAVKKSGRR